MPARLFCKTGDLAGMAYFIDREAMIGRLDENQIALYPSYISGHHARIYFDDDEERYFLEDLNSSNGTRLDDTPVTEPVRLGPLHVITFARRVDFIFQVLAEAPTAGPGAPVQDTPFPEDARERTRMGDIFAPLPNLSDLPAEKSGEVTTLRDPFVGIQTPVEPEDAEEKTSVLDAFTPMPTLEEEPPEEPPPSEIETLAETPPSSEDIPGDEVTAPMLSDVPVPFMLRVTMPDKKVATFWLKEGAQIIGREWECDLTIPDPSISRRHARITVETGTVTLEDLGSKNATFVDGQKLTEATVIDTTNLIRFGLSIEAVLERGEDSA